LVSPKMELLIPKDRAARIITSYKVWNGFKLFLASRRSNVVSN
jgi:hypothetical protein